nr:MAG TPA: hypothetical protein [Caudoviricetes sp.]
MLSLSAGAFLFFNTTFGQFSMLLMKMSRPKKQ